MSITTDAPAFGSPATPGMNDFLAEARRALAHWAPAVPGAAAARLHSSALRNAVAADRAHLLPVLAVLQTQQPRLVERLGQALADGLRGSAPGAAAPPAPKSGERLVLSLVEEDRIDENIEIARIVQALESQAEWELSQLAALCSSLTGQVGISNESNPLRPVILARALRKCCQDLDLAAPARLLLLRELGAAAAQTLPDLYKRLASWLLERGVTPAGFQVRRTEATPAARTAPTTSATPHRRAASARAGAPQPASSALTRLVAWARDNVPAAPTEPAADLDVVPLRLLSTPTLAGETAELDTDTAVRVMDRLLTVLMAQASSHAGMGRLMMRLSEPGRRLAATDRELWTSLDHPWWQLVDRVMAAAAVNDDEDPASATLTASLEQAVHALVNGDGAQLEDCRRAVKNVDFAVTGLLDERNTDIAPLAMAMQAQVDREGLEHDYRGQIVEQLRSVPAPAGLRQFLLGPWSIVLAATALRHGKDSDEMLRRAQFVDVLLEHGARAAGEVLAPPLLDRLVRRAGRGMMDAEMGRDRVVAELSDLRAVLAEPGPAAQGDPLGAVPPLPVAQVIGLHAGLPTVPIDMLEPAAGSPAATDRRAWLDALQPGDYCRLFILERWLTTQLHWRSANGSMYVFSSRHAGRLHSLSRRALDKLRAAGLAATIQHGQLIAQAMDTLSDESGTRH